jgi:hypothetical protein
MTTAQETASTAIQETGAVAGTAKDEALNVASTATDAAKGVAQTAAQQTADVVGEAARQARDLVGETRDQVRTQAETQTKRLAENVRSLAGEINGMASRSDQQGPATEIALQIADKTQALAGYLDGTTPEAVLEDLRTFARRKPGLFLLGAAGVGFLAGRLVKGATASSGDTGSEIAGGTSAGTGLGTAAGAPVSGMTLPPGTGTVTPAPATITPDPYPTAAQPSFSTPSTPSPSIGGFDG